MTEKAICEVCGEQAESDLDLEVYHRACRLKAAFPGCYTQEGPLVMFDPRKMSQRLKRTGETAEAQPETTSDAGRVRMIDEARAWIRENAGDDTEDRLEIEQMLQWLLAYTARLRHALIHDRKCEWCQSRCPHAHSECSGCTSDAVLAEGEP